MIEFLILGMLGFQGEAPGPLTGRVVDADSGEAIRDATVIFNPAGGGRAQPLFSPSGHLANGRIGPLRAPRPAAPQATSGGDGAFRLSVAPGTYQVDVQRDGFAKYLHPTAVTLVKDHTPPPLILKLRKHSVITGRVSGEDGNPMAGARVTALMDNLFQGSAMVESTAVTNQAGEFRLAGLPSGRYLVSAQGADAGPAYATVYFPGVRQLAAAERFDLSPGEIRQGVDVRMMKVSVVKVSGRVTELPPGRPGPPGRRGGTDGLMVLLQSREDTPVGPPLPPPVINDQGEFTFASVASGSYTLVVFTFLPSQERRVTRVRLEVGDQDLTGIIATLAPPLVLTGRVVAPGRPAPAGVTIALQPKSSQVNFPGNAQTDARGRFQLYDLENEEYRPRVADLPAGYYVQSMRIGGAEVKDTLDLAAGVPGELVITLDDAPAKISGRVIGKNQQPIAGASVLLLDSQPEMYTAQTTAQGQYSFEDLAPGDYILGVTTSPNFLSPEVVDNLRKTGQKITLVRSAHEIRALELR